MEQSTILTEVAWVGQVDLILTKIGHYLLLLGFQIQVKFMVINISKKRLFRQGYQCF